MRRWIAILLAACALAPPLRADTPPVIDSFTLANGLEVIVLPNHRVSAVSHMLWYRVGAIDDPPSKSGLAHFHEHVMYLGTAQHSGGQYADLIARAGGKEN